MGEEIKGVMSENLEVSGGEERSLGEFLSRGTGAADSLHAIFVFCCLEVPGLMKRSGVAEVRRTVNRRQLGLEVSALLPGAKGGVSF